MKLLIKQACITDPLSSHHGTIQDILIENGTIREIAPSVSEKTDQVIDHPGLQVSPGWVDIFSNFADPGYEFKETLETGAAAAADHDAWPALRARSGEGRSAAGCFRRRP